MMQDPEFLEMIRKQAAKEAVRQLEATRKMLDLLGPKYRTRSWRERLFTWPWRPWRRLAVDDQWSPREVRAMEDQSAPAATINRIPPIP